MAVGDFFNFGGVESNTLFVLIFFTAVLVIYSIFVFYFYRFLAKKNIISLNLADYNNYDNPKLTKFFAVFLYIVEFIIVLPVVTFFWFAILAILILVLSEGIGVDTILLISAALVASVRATAYVSEQLSTDLAKMLPFTLIAIAITKPSFFEVETLFERIAQVPELLSNIPYFIIFIIAIEIIMRMADTLNSFIRPITEPIREE